MVRPGTPSEPLLSALAGGQAVLVLGPGLAHGLTGLDLGSALDTLRPQVSDASGWDTLDLQDRLLLVVESHGRERLEAELANAIPSVEALRAQVTDFHRLVLGLPCAAIVSTTGDGLVEATLDALGTPYRAVVDDEDVERALSADDGGRLLVKAYGDLLGGEGMVLTRDERADYENRRPATWALLRGLMAERTVLLYGLDLEDPAFRHLVERLLGPGARPRATYALMKETNSLRVQYWGRRRVEIVSGNTWSDLERWVEGLAREVSRRRAARG